MCKNVMRLTMTALVILWTGCSGFHQPGAELNHLYSRVYITDYNTAWQAVLDAVKSFERTVVNRQGGIIQTAYIDNTAEKNFTDSFGSSETYLKSKYRLTITVAPGRFQEKNSVKVTILKEQLVQRDLMEGWQSVQSDSIDENTILYRVGRVISIKLKLKQIEEEKTERVLREGV